VHDALIAVRIGALARLLISFCAAVIGVKVSTLRQSLRQTGRIFHSVPEMKQIGLPFAVQVLKNCCQVQHKYLPTVSSQQMSTQINLNKYLSKAHVKRDSTGFAIWAVSVQRAIK